jgi:sialate O-acetylesterase
MKKFSLVFIFCLVALKVSYATVALPKIFSDNMVLQRDVAIRVWGWADRSESVTITFNGQTIKVKADKNGNWNASLKPISHGGPFEMKVAGKSNTIVLKNILIGDVWVGSGQSNMEWTIENTKDADQEIAQANYPKIRLFTVKKATRYEPQKDLAGGEWLECSPKTIRDFSAVAYFFGRKLQQELEVPIGLINSSWGGTNIQAWISWDVMSQKDQYKGTDINKLKESTKDLAAKQAKYEAALKNERGDAEKWYESNNLDGWKTIDVPKLWESTEIGNADGYVWFRKEFEISSPPDKRKPVTLSLGPIDDQDQTYVNGTLVGSTNAYNQDRLYKIDPSLLKQGKNVVIVRVLDTGGGGGIYGKPDQMYVSINETKIPLAGQWQYRASVLNTQFGISDAGPNSFPSQLYNAMIAPFIQFPIKGVIWYQGESNTWEAARYQQLFKELITDWRQKWNLEFSFFWAQLANFMAPDDQPKQSEWAELRESQTKTLALPKTGQAVIIDIGEADDIHPRNKQDVGNRLALAALKIAYGKDIVYSGPVYKSMQKSGNKIILSFENIGTGLMAKDKYGYLRAFAIAGADQKFVWARAELQGDKVIVYSDLVAEPVAVRYAWGNNPDDANLYNREGLPASPFRTDDWKGISQGQ